MEFHAEAGEQQLSASTALLEAFDDQLSPEGRTGEITSILAKIEAGLDVEHFETLRVRKDGTVFPVLLTDSPTRRCATPTAQSLVDPQSPET